MSMTISSNAVLALLSGLTVTDALKVKAINVLDANHDAITDMINNGMSVPEALELTRAAAGDGHLYAGYVLNEDHFAEKNFREPVVQDIRKTSVDSASSAGSGTTVSSSVDSILNFAGKGAKKPTADEWIYDNIHMILLSNHPDPKYADYKSLMSSQGFDVQEELMDFTMDAKRAIYETWLHPRDDEDLSPNLPGGRQLGEDSEGNPSFEAENRFIKNENGSLVLDELNPMERAAFEDHYEFLAKHVDVLPKEKAKGGKSDASPIFFKLQKSDKDPEQHKQPGFVVKIFPKGAQELAATEYFMADLCKETRHRLSALTPYLSLHTVKWDQHTRLVAVMPNVAHAPEKLSFDVTEPVSKEAAETELERIEDGLGGSPIADIKGNPVRGSRMLDHPFWKKEEEHAKNIDHQLNLVIANSELKRLAAVPQQGKYLMGLLKQDTAALAKKGLTDYSLIVKFYKSRSSDLFDAARGLWTTKAKAVVIDYPMRIDDETPMSRGAKLGRLITKSATKPSTAFWLTWIQGIDIVLNGAKSASGLFTIGQRAQTPAITEAVSDAAVAARAHNLKSIS